MIGAGFKPPQRKMIPPDQSRKDKIEWTTLDMNRSAKPDIVFNLNRIESWIPWWNRIPVRDEYFDEIHANQVFEHYGRQGDFKGFFRGMRELWRILKPGGWFIGDCPHYNSVWAWGDPGHTRVINTGTFVYLTKQPYGELGDTPASDYSKYVSPRWWTVEHSVLDEEREGYYFGLRKVVE